MQAAEAGATSARSFLEVVGLAEAHSLSLPLTSLLKQFAREPAAMQSICETK
jgi:hypothetical protein